MATVTPEKDEYSVLVEAEHAHDHEHAEFIAHHFSTAEQQFDSGKLGIWLFLITEVLFFSGLFVAYISYRYNHPEVFIEAHIHLDKFLGGINTVVLLFSSLTMAWGVRAAQMGDNKTTTWCVLATMICASAFLGVKAVEYSHKWDVGLLPGEMFSFDPSHAHADHMISNYLLILSLPFALLLVGFAVAGALYWNTGAKLLGQFFAGMALTCLGYFAGAAGGIAFMALTGPSHGPASHGSDVHQNGSHGTETHSDSTSVDAGNHAAISGQQQAAINYVTTLNSSNSKPPGADTPDASGKDADVKDAGSSGTDAGTMTPEEAAAGSAASDTRLGIFFSIYYCMTGLHAIHIIGGIIALAWIFYRSLALHWRPDYFGPVDFVGLYWHLVDLIWIYLFPLMYLIK